MANRNSKKIVAERATRPFSAIRNPKVRKINLSPRKFWRLWSDEVPDTEVLGCKNKIFDFRGCLELTASYSQNRVIVVASLRGISQTTRYGVLVRKGPAKKKLVQQTIASRWWWVITVRSLQAISRYAALWFWDLVCSAAVRSLHVLGRSPVCRSFC